MGAMFCKRFLLFCCNQYYPSGGWSDLFGSFDTLDEAIEAFKPRTWDYGEIVDLETGERRTLPNDWS